MCFLAYLWGKTDVVFWTSDTVTVKLLFWLSNLNYRLLFLFNVLDI